ncbi:MAG: hypothetical protein Ta2F_07710 [Termitinemataceae bacterium]|nr:MAG: hypothetical protein Ta2F_07710 [Termitinemataceae bacterium]
MAKRHGLCLIFFFICTVFPAAQEEEDLQTDNDAQLQSADVRSDLLDVNAERASILGEEPSEILSLTVKDTDVSLFMHGYWKGTFGAQWGFQKNRFGIIPERLQPIIEQEPNLDISLWIYKKWFVEAFFEEGNSEGLQVSSYAAGFKGDQDDFVQFAVIGNKGLDFPKYPYINLGGDTPLYDASSSVGFYGKFGANKLKLHMLVRYDIASREERIFVGNSERSYSYLGPSARIRGISFVLPQKNIQNNITVYIEDKKGDYSGDGSLWRIAKPGEYATSATFGLVELATTPSGKVAVHYGTLPTYKNAMGFYGDGSSFLNEAQRYFYENDLTLYPQAGQSIIATGDPKNTPGVITINGNDCLVIYEAGTFSPFERQTLYKSPTSNSVSASLVNSSTNDRINGFTITERADNSLWYDNGGGFNKNFGLDTNAYIVTQRSIFELMLETETYDARSVRSRWSIARDLNNAQWNSLVYLTDNFNTDVSLRWTNLSSANGYYIGTDVVEGSVQVKRSGLDDPDFNFNNSSGYVTLANSAGINEIIRITYLKRSNQSNNGSLAAGLGTVWNVNDHFTTSSALAFRWNVFDQEQFSQYGNASPGTLALTNKFNWNYEKVQANFNIGGGWERTDTIGLYRAAGMEGSEQIIYLNEQNSFISTPPRNNPPDISNLYIGNRADLRYRNYKKTETLGNSYLMDITENAAVQEDVLGPYQANDPSLGGVILAAEFALDPSPLPLQNWSGFQVQIANGTILSEAREIELPFRFYDFNNYNNFSVVVQIGTLPVKDSAANENTELLIQKTIFSSAADTWHESPRLVRLILNDDERRKLQNANYIRYVFINNGSANISGRFLAAPLIVRGAKFAPIIKENGTAKNAQNNVTTTEMPDNAAASLNSRYSKIITRLHKDDPKQRVLQLKWDTLQAAESVWCCFSVIKKYRFLLTAIYKKVQA